MLNIQIFSLHLLKKYKIWELHSYLQSVIIFRSLHSFCVFQFKNISEVHFLELRGFHYFRKSLFKYEFNQCKTNVWKEIREISVNSNKGKNHALHFFNFTCIYSVLFVEIINALLMPNVTVKQSFKKSLVEDSFILLYFYIS